MSMRDFAHSQPTQDYYHLHERPVRRETPEQRLYLALLECALHDLASRGPSTSAEARAWFESHDNRPGSFVYACDALNMDAENVRQWVLG